MFATPISMKLNNNTAASNTALMDRGRIRRVIAIILVRVNTHWLAGDGGGGGDGEFFVYAEQASSRMASSTLALRLELQDAGDGDLCSIDMSLKNRRHSCCVADTSLFTAPVEGPAGLLEADIANKIELRQASGP